MFLSAFVVHWTFFVNRIDILIAKWFPFLADYRYGGGSRAPTVDKHIPFRGFKELRITALSARGNKLMCRLMYTLKISAGLQMAIRKKNAFSYMPGSISSNPYLLRSPS